MNTETPDAADIMLARQMLHDEADRFARHNMEQNARRLRRVANNLAAPAAVPGETTRERGIEAVGLDAAVRELVEEARYGRLCEAHAKDLGAQVAALTRQLEEAVAARDLAISSEYERRKEAAEARAKAIRDVADAIRKRAPVFDPATHPSSENETAVECYADAVAIAESLLPEPKVTP